MVAVMCRAAQKEETPETRVTCTWSSLDMWMDLTVEHRRRSEAAVDSLLCVQPRDFTVTRKSCFETFVFRFSGA